MSVTTTFTLKGRTTFSSAGYYLVANVTSHELRVAWPLKGLNSAKDILKPEKGIMVSESLKDADDATYNAALMTLLFAPKKVTFRSNCRYIDPETEPQACGLKQMTDSEHSKYQCIKSMNGLTKGFIFPSGNSVQRMQAEEKKEYDIQRLSYIAGFIDCEDSEIAGNAYDMQLSTICENFSGYIVFVYELGDKIDHRLLSDCLEIDFEVGWNHTMLQNGESTFIEGYEYPINTYPFERITEIQERLNNERITYPIYQDTLNQNKTIIYTSHYDGNVDENVTYFYPNVDTTIPKGKYMIDVEVYCVKSTREVDICLYDGDTLIYSRPATKLLTSFSHEFKEDANIAVWYSDYFGKGASVETVKLRFCTIK